MIIVLSIALFALLLIVSARLNRGNFLLGPSGIHAAYFSCYVFIPAVFLYLLQPPSEVGTGAAVSIGNECMLALCISMFGFIAGSLLISRRKPKPVKIVDTVGAPGHRYALFGLIFLALLLTFAFIASNFRGMLALALGSFSEHYADVQQFKTEALYGANWLLQGMNQIIPIAVLFLLMHGYIHKRPSKGAKWLIAFAVAFQFITGGLWVGFSILVMVLMLRAYFVPESRKKVFRYGLALVFAVIAALALKYGLGASDENGLAIFGAFHRFTAGARQLQWLIDTEHDYQFGFTYIRDLIAMVPSPIKRPLLPEEYWGGFNGIMFYKMYGFYGGTTQIPLIGESYVNGGFLWVFSMSVLHGAAVQKLSSFLKYHQARTTFGAVAAVVIGYRLGECVVEGIGTRLFVSLLWMAIFYAVVRVYGSIVEIAHSNIHITASSPTHASRT